MKNSPTSILGLAVASALSLPFSPVYADSITDAIKSGKAKADIRLRYEAVEQENSLEDATASTIRTRLGYSTGKFRGFSSTVEFEDVRVVASQDDYSVPPTGFQTGSFSVVADPEVTELDQGFLQYSDEVVSVKAGRQVLTYDNHRHVGHVGWRQDRQTFDGLTATFTPLKDLKINGAYLTQRNRIFAEAADITSKDLLLNASYKTPVGTVVAYSYLLEIDNDTDNGLDTVGLRFSGAQKMDDIKILYTAEVASQEAESGGSESDATYLFLEGGAIISGIAAKLGYEVLGSDGGNYGFSTPLATLHKFNGWADIFLATPGVGLVDISLTVGGKVADGKLLFVYHDYSADESTATLDDLGSEINLLYARKFGKHYNGGIKYAAYSAGDAYVDTDKLWAWVGLSF